ncbi:MAG: S8 family serine peptidase [Elusimicrobiota bacterium]|jgi:subtilisin family serine protease
MRTQKSIGLLIGLTLWFGGGAAAKAPVARSTVPRRASDHILVKFRSQATAAKRTAALAHLRVTEKHTLSPIGVKVLSVPAGVTPEEMINRIQTEMGNEVEFAELDTVQFAQKIPNDPLLSSQYHLNKTACPAAWDTTSGAGITIAIADTGVMPTHPDLAGHLVPGVNVAEGNLDTSDQEGHGTTVAGAAAAIGDNNLDVAGVAYNASIMPIKIVEGADDFSYSVVMASAIIYAADHGIKVLNMSFGSDFCDSVVILQAADYMRSKGGLVIKSAGNSSINRGCAQMPGLVYVSATDADDHLTDFSNFGQEIGVSAPGSAILTTNCNGCLQGPGHGEVDTVAGTSFSSPITAGVMALIFSIDSTFTPEQAQQILFDSTDDLGDPGYDIYYGWGRVNASRAVELAKQRSITFQLNSLTNVYAYPNPWDVRRTGNRLMTFANIPDGASVKIFTLSGFWVKNLTPSNGRATWDLTNSAGEPVASGLYFYLIKSSDGEHKARGTVAIIK